MSRQFSHAALKPLENDVVEIVESRIRDGSHFDFEAMLRVLAVRDDHVWFKEYGVGRLTVHVKQWRNRLQNARVGKLVQSGDKDCPF